MISHADIDYFFYVPPFLGCSNILYYDRFIVTAKFMSDSFVKHKLHLLIPSYLLPHTVNSNEFRNLNVISYNSSPRALQYKIDHGRRLLNIISNTKNRKYSVLISPSFCPIESSESLLVLNDEAGFFSRPPFPSTTCLDPVGPGFGFINKFWDNFKAKNLMGNDFLSSFSKYYSDKLLSDSPFRQQCDALKQKYEKLILMPLQITCDPISSFNSQIGNQTEAILYVLNCIPNTWGLIITDHPTARYLGDFLSDSSFYALQTKYPNLLRIKDIDSYIYSSQYILPFADATIGGSSSVLLQGLVLGKPFISIGKNFYSKIATVNCQGKLTSALFSKPALTDHQSNVISYIFKRFMLTHESKKKHFQSYMEALQCLSAKYFEIGMCPTLFDDIWENEVPDYIEHEKNSWKPIFNTNKLPEILPIENCIIEFKKNQYIDRHKMYELSADNFIFLRNSTASSLKFENNIADVNVTSTLESHCFFYGKMSPIDALANAVCNVSFYLKGTPGKHLVFYIYFHGKDNRAQGIPQKIIWLTEQWSFYSIDLRMPNLATDKETSFGELMFMVSSIQQSINFQLKELTVVKIES